LNEDRYLFAPEIVDLEGSEIAPQARTERTLIQAWFLGTHGDMGGAKSQDGLSLYPLQWMMIESHKVGLLLHFKSHSKADDIDDPLNLVFPTTYPFHAPPNKGDLWKIRFKGRLEVEMHCLDSIFQKEGFKPRVNYLGTLLTGKARAPFAEDGKLRGWKANGEVSLYTQNAILTEEV
jgi:Uncharacterized alpha/beta hydrolase domain (DUF2235)